jgi:antitoxin MazE
MHVRIQKWGNSLAVRIPQHLAKQAHLTEGTEVDLTGDSEKVVINPVAIDPPLDELVARITPQNLHEAADFGGPRGSEAW